MHVINRALHIAAVAAAPLASATQHIQVDQSKYGVEVFECTANLDELSFQDRQVKMHEGSVIRVCFRPNQAAMEDGVRIRSIHEFFWEMEHKDGLAEQVAVENGEGESALSQLECVEGGKLCVLDTMLGGDFYANEASVLGTGSAFLTAGDKPTPIRKWMFQAEFQYELTDLADDELTREEEEELMRLYKEQQDALLKSGEELVRSYKEQQDALPEPKAQDPDEDSSKEQPTCNSPAREEGDAAQSA